MLAGSVTKEVAQLLKVSEDKLDSHAIEDWMMLDYYTYC